MADPFNPRRFLYESNSHSDFSNTADFARTCSPPTGVRATALELEQDIPAVRSRSGIATSTVQRPDTGMQPVQTHRELISATGKYADSFWSRYAVSVVVCVALAAISCYSILYAVERWPRPSSSLDCLPPAIQAYVDQAILRVSRDPVGRPDFALHADGGRVIPELTGIVRDDVLVLPSANNSPNLSLTDDTRIGSCWKFPQDAGQLGFRTSQMLFPTHVTIDHIPIEVSQDIGQAPRSMVLWGAVDGSSNIESLRGLSENPSRSIPPHLERPAPPFTANLTFITLAAFEYDIYSPNNVQTFPLLPLIVESHMSFGVFVLDIIGNWGGDATCLYRIRVHGESTLQ